MDGIGGTMPFKSVSDEMGKFKAGDLHSGRGGKVVTNPKQAIAISLSEARRAGEKVAKNPLRGHGSRVEKA